MSRFNLFGNLPTIKVGPNKGRLDREKVAELYCLSIKQVYKAYNNWIQIFRIKESNLTFEQYLNKLKEANITPDNLGNDNNDWHLSRYDDESPYSLNTCRFVYKHINMYEQIIHGKNKRITK